MLDEDTVIKTLRNNNEYLLLFNIVFAVSFPVILFGAPSELVAGVFISLGIVAPINVCNYISAWSPTPNKQLRFFLLCATPFLISLVITIIGMINGGLIAENIGENSYLKLAQFNKFTPMNAFAHPLTPISGELVSIMAFLAGLSIFMITDSRFVIRKILLATTTTVIVISILGVLIGLIGDCAQLQFQTYKNSFATFVDGSQWASFAIIWLGASWAMALYSGQKFRFIPFVNSVRFLGIALAVLLLFGVVIAGKPIHQFFALLISAVALAMFANDVAPIQSNTHRHEMLRHISSHSARLKKMKAPFAVYSLLALIMLLGVIKVVLEIKNDTSLLLTDTSNKNAITYAEKSALWQDSAEMITENRLLFGYGTASFSNVFSFHQGSDLDSVWTSPQSDLLQKLLENGVVGLALNSLTFLFLLIRWLCKRSFSAGGIIMMMSVLAILLISIVENPFQSIAVLTSFWILVMSWFRWDDAKVG